MDEKTTEKEDMVALARSTGNRANGGHEGEGDLW